VIGDTDGLHAQFGDAIDSLREFRILAAQPVVDLFLEEDLEYARRLLRAGVPVELHVYPGGFHAFNVAPGVTIAAMARRDSTDALARALA
jgi:triacylglycerol lipase